MSENKGQGSDDFRTIRFSTSGTVYEIDQASLRVKDEHGRTVTGVEEKRVLSAYKRFGSLGY